MIAYLRSGAHRPSTSKAPRGWSRCRSLVTAGSHAGPSRGWRSAAAPECRRRDGPVTISRIVEPQALIRRRGAVCHRPDDSALFVAGLSLGAITRYQIHLRARVGVQAKSRSMGCCRSPAMPKSILRRCSQITSPSRDDTFETTIRNDRRESAARLACPGTASSHHLVVAGGAGNEDFRNADGNSATDVCSSGDARQVSVDCSLPEGCRMCNTRG